VAQQGKKVFSTQMKEEDARKTRRWFGAVHRKWATPNHLRVLRASSSFICVEILPSRCRSNNDCGSIPVVPLLRLARESAVRRSRPGMHAARVERAFG
jgi:hypothetical protein